MEPPRSRKSAAPRAPRVVADTDGAAHTAAFRGRALPGIPVRRYVERIYRYAGCGPAAYVYLDRLARGRNLDADWEGGADEEAAVVGIDSYTVHRLLITSVLVAAKFMDDRHYNNAYFARVGGVEVSEMNALELRLLFALRFRLNVALLRRAALECHVVTADPAVPLPLPSSSPVSDDDELVTEEKAAGGS